MNNEDDWLRTIARENHDSEHARRIQPGRGHRVHQPDHDWFVLFVVLVLIIAGFAC